MYLNPDDYILQILKLSHVSQIELITRFYYIMHASDVHTCGCNISNEDVLNRDLLQTCAIHINKVLVNVL